MDNEKIETLCKGFFEQAQVLFGPIHSGWKFVGVEFGAGPHLVYLPGTKEVLISLSDRARTDEVQLWFQLSHEICHLLHPSRDAETGELDQTTVLNEGLSTLFSCLMTSKISDRANIITNINATPYAEGFTLVAELLGGDSESIKRLRRIQPRIDRVTKEQFISANIDFPDDGIAALLRPFDVHDDGLIKLGPA